MDKEVENIYKSAKDAISQDLRQNYYRAAQNRNVAFRQANNVLNTRHAMFSGAPTATQQQYDRDQYLPTLSALSMRALQQQEQNQRAWDQHMAMIKELNAQANYYNKMAGELGNGVGGKKGDMDIDPYGGYNAGNKDAGGGGASGSQSGTLSDLVPAVKQVINGASLFNPAIGAGIKFGEGLYNKNKDAINGRLDAWKNFAQGIGQQISNK